MKTTETPLRILLIDEQAIIRTGLKMLLESHPRFVVVGEAANFPDLLSASLPAADILLLDLKSFHGEDNLNALTTLQQNVGKARIVLLTDQDEVEVNLRAVRLGAMGLVNKNEAAEVLLKAIERVYAGEVWINRSLMAHVIGGLGQVGVKAAVAEDPEAKKIKTLTEREREVVTLIGEGLRNRQIAARLLISEITVRHHLTSIFDKLEVSDRFELAIYSYRHRLAKLPL